MINVEEEGQVVAFYHLITQHYRGERVGAEEAEEAYAALRKLLRENLTK